ncbi:hypothetical protein JY651_13460 [Pyxidicoccus parkwayensis]|uniref:RING-type E3 ubiquitin transferase n=1 Tax=Pyxidicoccus parkwayensis TaxID=2813578 RepID=A0ABX7P5V6_9BACT|nr:hypothetical protein [Pyxidicoccus parkwaysis]QSQ25867.1 hypothetical protein JY651_13460 [Pyxidicoccus parkwaysis]
MDLWRILLAPLYAMCLAALVVAAFAFGRKDAARPWRVPLTWFGLLVLGACCVSLRFHGGPAQAVSFDVVEKAAGAALLVVAAGLAVRGSRVRFRADLLRASVPKSLDEAVAALRAGQSPGWGVYRGSLDAADSLTSPGGVPCAFYEAEVREVAEDGRKGPLLSRERAYAPVLGLKGGKVRASVRFSPSSLMAPVEVRRCQALQGTVPASWYEDATGTEATTPEALSWERVGATGETCLVVGELRRGAEEGSYVLCGRDGGPALVVLGPEAPVTGGMLARRAWTHFAAAGALSMAAAFVLSRTL